MDHIIDGLVRDHQVDVLVVRDDKQAHGENVRGARVLRVSMPKDTAKRIEVFQRALRRQLGAVEYDVVQFRDGWSGVTTLEMKRKHKFVTVFDVTRSPMSLSTASDLATATELQRAHESCLRRADLVLAPTDEAQQFFAGMTDAPKVHVVPPGVNIDRFDWDSPTGGGRPIVLYLGKIGKDCGIQLLLRAMESVQKNSDAMLLMAGPSTPEFLGRIKSEIDDLKLTQSVRVLGEIPHRRIPAAIALSTLCVIPQAASMASGPAILFPSKVLEFMACRRTVVAPRSTSVEQIIADGQHGLLFEDGDPRDLAKKIMTLLNDPVRRREMELLGYEKVRCNFSASGTRRKLRSAYAWLSKQSAYRRRMSDSVGLELASDSILLVGSDLLVAADEEMPALPSEYTNEVNVVAAPSVEVGEVTKVEANPLLQVRPPRASSPPELVDVAGTINVDIAKDPWAPLEGGTSEVDEDAGTGEIDPVPWIDEDSIEIIDDNSGLSMAVFKEDTDTETRLAAARSTSPRPIHSK